MVFCSTTSILILLLYSLAALSPHLLGTTCSGGWFRFLNKVCFYQRVCVAVVSFTVYEYCLCYYSVSADERGFFSVGY